MPARYILASRAIQNLLAIWNYIKQQSNADVTDRVESVILAKMDFLARSPGAGHRRLDLADESVRFFSVYSYLIVYLPETKPLRVLSVVHGRQDVEQILKERT